MLNLVEEKVVDGGKRSPQDPPAIPGMRYVCPLGYGGFADIGMYEQDFPRRKVAVKVMHASVTGDESGVVFKKEANALALLSSHPSILTIHSASVSADGRPYLVLEYCQSSLGDTFRSQPLSVSEVLDLGVRIASALETCHRFDFLHRDIKPSNLLMTKYGKIVLSDFGIVSPIRGVERGNYFGLSIPWSAPEILVDSSLGSVASEIWGLSATLYSLLAGRGPFEETGCSQNSESKIVSRIMRAKYTPIGRADIPHVFQKVLMRGMSKSWRARQRSALEFAQQLRGIQHSLGLQVTALEVEENCSFSPGVNGKNSFVTDLFSGGQPVIAGGVRCEVPLGSQRRRQRRSLGCEGSEML